jgi:hypothetical protein
MTLYVTDDTVVRYYNVEAARVADILLRAASLLSALYRPVELLNCSNEQSFHRVRIVERGGRYVVGMD